MGSFRNFPFHDLSEIPQNKQSILYNMWHWTLSTNIMNILIVILKECRTLFRILRPCNSGKKL